MGQRAARRGQRCYQRSEDGERRRQGGTGVAGRVEQVLPAGDCDGLGHRRQAGSLVQGDGQRDVAAGCLLPADGQQSRAAGG